MSVPAPCERRQTQCPRCQSAALTPLPVINPSSNLQWFECGDCGHMSTRSRTATSEEQRVPPAALGRRSSAASGASSSAGPIVLVIDDVDATRSGLAQLLRLRGFDAREAANGVDGL